MDCIKIEQINLKSCDGKLLRKDANMREKKINDNTRVVEFIPDLDDDKVEAALEIFFKIPIEGISGLWSPLRSSGFENQNFLKWEHSFTASLDYFYPVLAFVDRELGHKGLLSFLSYDTTCSFNMKLSQKDECYNLVFRYPNEGYLNVAQWDKISFYISEAAEEKKIFDSIKEFVGYYHTEILKPVPKSDIPDCAYEPVYCTWYAVHGSPTAQWAENTGKLAAELGFKNFIMDDGWFHDLYKRVGDSLEGWFDQIGDWEPSDKKFPDFKQHVKNIQDMGLKYILWYNPYAVGKASRKFESSQSLIGTPAGEDGSSYYCVQDKRAYEIVLDTSVRLVKDYDVDGFKVDFLYGVDKCNCKNLAHTHFEAVNGRAVAKTMQEMYKRIKEIKPDFNMMHIGGPYMNSFSTSMRSIDVPFDPDTNLFFLVYIKLFAPNIPVQSDPLFWPQNTPLKDIARHFIVSMFSVPSISVDLINLSKKEMDLVKNWLSFYKKYFSVLTTGDFAIGNIGPLISHVASTFNNISVIGLFRSELLDLPEVKNCVVMNATSKDKICICINGISCKATTYDVEFNKIDEIKEINGSIVEVSVPVGGFVELEMSKKD